MSDGCPYIAGPQCEGCNGWCWEPAPPEPTVDELCAAKAHAYYADDSLHTGRCYCGLRSYQAGGPTADDSAQRSDHVN